MAALAARVGQLDQNQRSTEEMGDKKRENALLNYSAPSSLRPLPSPIMPFPSPTPMSRPPSLYVKRGA
eukprot:5324823-Pleurochrysis_carterae.AAC.2